MSRTGKAPVDIPDKVEATLSDLPSGSQCVKVKGPKGELELTTRKEVKVSQEEKTLVVTRTSDEKLARSLHGTTRSLIQNMVIGVSAGFTRELDIVGVGYRAQMQGTKLVLQVGHSHPVEIEPPNSDIKIEVEKQVHIKITGTSKQDVGDLAAKIRSTRPPEPYKGKGIKYTDEVIRRKAGKSAGGGAAK